MNKTVLSPAKAYVIIEPDYPYTLFLILNRKELKQCLKQVKISYLLL